MYKLWASIYKEFLLLIRDVGGLTILFVMPLVLVITITLIQDSSFKSVQQTKIPILIVDNDYLKVFVNGQIVDSGDTNIEDIERSELRLGDSRWNSFNGYIKHFRYYKFSFF